VEEGFTPIFKKYKLKFQSKQKDFEIFCDLMKRFKKKEHYTLEGLRNLLKIKSQMH